MNNKKNIIMKNLNQNITEEELKCVPVNTAMNPYVSQTAEGKTIAFEGEEAIDKGEIRTFLFNSPKQVIEIISHEFQAVCPFSGLPDVAKIVITYLPEGGKALELKALKYYLGTFRNVGVYQERVNQIIYNDLKEALQTEKLKVTMSYNVRGGLYTTTTEGSL